jgi:hypothetical protein
MSRALSKKTWPPGTIFHYLVTDDKACYAFHGKHLVKSMALCGPGAVGVLTSGVDAVTCKKCLHLLTTRKGRFK